MFTNYLKTAWRNLVHYKSYTIINMTGLAIGIAVCIVIFIIIQFLSGFNNFHSKKDRIYRVLTEYHHADSKDIFYGRGVPFAMPKGLKSDFKDLEQVAAVYADHNNQIMVPAMGSMPAKKFKEEKGVFYTEPSFFNVFDFPLIAGAYASLNDPNNALLTQETAERYFGDWKSAIGKTIKLNNTETLKVSGVLANIPSNTDFQLKVVVAYGTGFTQRIATSTDWDGTGSSFGCYVVLPEHASEFNFNKRLRAYVQKMKSPENKDSHTLQPLSEVHFDTRAGDYSGKTVSHKLINVLWLIAGFILLIACVNFINLATAQAVNRAKEVGVRKVLGSNRWRLKIQFLMETFLIVLTSVILATLASTLALPSVNKILELSLAFSLLANPGILFFLFAIVVIVTLLAGFYPSVVLSGYNPINALKNAVVVKNSSGLSLRRGLVVFQFVISQALIIGTLILVKQMDYFTSQSLGFDKDAMVNVPFLNDSTNISKLDHLKRQLSGISGVENVSFSSNTPIEDDNDNWSMFQFDHSSKQTDFYAITKFADQKYVPAYKLQLVAGRNMYASDTGREFLVNEVLVKNLGIKDPQLAIGKEINLWNGAMKGAIVGVLKNFNDRSFRREIAPMLLTSQRREYSQAGIKITTSSIAGTLASVNKVWTETFPDYVFEYEFLDEKVAGFYVQEFQLMQLYKILAIIAIFLSCLGLYGLASFMAVQRIKEVGIRKVLGATVLNILYLFSKEFIVLIAVAFLIAVPVSWYYMNEWIKDYPFRTTFNWWLFIIGGACAVAIALSTVSFQAIKAARANPARSLRSN